RGRHRRLGGRSKTKGGPKGKSHFARADWFRAARVLDHIARTFAPARWNPWRVSGIQNSRRDNARNHLGGLFRAFLSRSLSGGVGGLGSDGAFHPGRGPRDHRNTFLRAFDNRL